MATTTANLGLTKPTVGADADAWGTQLNASLDTLDAKVLDKTTGGTVTGPLSVTGALSGNGANLTSLTAGNITANGTLPVLSGANLTNLNASNLASGTVPTARLSGEYPIVAGDNIIPLAASVAANALTVTLNPTALAFRSTTLSSGASTVQNVASAISLTVPSGATLGTINGIASRLVVLAIYTGTAVELAIVNIAGGNQLDETNLISTTAIGAGSTAENVIYSTTARTNVPYRVMGFVDSTQATAGAWATAPSLVQGVGGQALTALSSLGYGQTWQDVTGSRVLGTTYYNTTGKPIVIHVDAGVTSTASSATLTPVINGVTFSVLVISDSNGTGFASTRAPVHFEIPPQVSYRVTGTNATLAAWRELR